MPHANSGHALRRSCMMHDDAPGKRSTEVAARSATAQRLSSCSVGFVPLCGPHSRSGRLPWDRRVGKLRNHRRAWVLGPKARSIRSSDADMTPRRCCWSAAGATCCHTELVMRRHNVRSCAPRALLSSCAAAVLRTRGMRGTCAIS